MKLEDFQDEKNIKVSGLALALFVDHLLHEHNYTADQLSERLELVLANAKYDETMSEFIYFP